MENEVLAISRQLGIGAQFGGKYFCLDVRVIRLPRHGASCPIGVGVSCSADRNINAKITREGIFLEKLETDPAQYLPEVEPDNGAAVHIDLNRSMDEIRAELSKFPVATRLLLTGDIVVARDIAHARLKEQLDKGKSCPGTSGTILSIMRDRPKRRPVMPQAPSAPPPPGEWILTSPCFRTRRQHGDARQGKPEPAGHGCMQNIRRILSRVYRRTRGPAGQRVHYRD